MYRTKHARFGPFDLHKRWAGGILARQRRQGGGDIGLVRSGRVYGVLAGRPVLECVRARDHTTTATMTKPAATAATP